jgi:hypothetical protein
VGHIHGDGATMSFFFPLHNKEIDRKRIPYRIYPNRTKNLENMANLMLLPAIKYKFHFADFHKTHN